MNDGHATRRIRPFLLLLLLIACAVNALAQSDADPPFFSRLNTFGVAAEYSNDSSHILLGRAEQRKILSFAADYHRRLWISNIVNWQFVAELRPIMLESDPVIKEVFTSTSPPPTVTEVYKTIPTLACHTGSAARTIVYNGVTYTSNYVDTCSRRWTFGEGFLPVGSQFNFRPSHCFQPVFSFLGGYMFSTTPIPIVNAGSLNFMFEVGAGVELYRSRSRSVRAEYCVHHISNAYTAPGNPGIDNGLLKIVYSFGR